MASVSNLFVDQGSYYSRFITITTPTGAAFDITGYTVASQMRKNASSSTSYNIPCSLVDPAMGKIKIRLDATTTNNIPAGRYLYDIEITDGTGEKLRILEGIITIIPQMTKV